MGGVMKSIRFPKVQRAMRKAVLKKADEISGLIGDLDGVAIVPGKPNYLYVTLDKGVVVEAYNPSMPPGPGLPVRLEVDKFKPSQYVITGYRNIFVTDLSYPLIKAHRDAHTWSGYDPVPIELRQFMPLCPSASGFVLTIRGGWVKLESGWVYYNGESLDVSGSKPASGGRFVLVSISEAGTLTATEGIVKSSVNALKPLEDIPTLPDGHTPNCVVRLYAGQALIKDTNDTRTDLIDLRFTSLGFDAMTAAWGKIKGSLADQEDLNTALAQKLGDAPLDGKQYIRKDGSWQEVLSTGISDAPADGKTYGRKDNAWIEVTGGGGGIPDAPNDGNIYARQNEAWVEIDVPGAETPIDPLSIPGCVLFLKADSLTATDGDLIATWTDQSTSGNNATQATDANKPKYRVSVFNGKPALQFDNNDTLTLGTNIDLASCTIFVVFSAVAKGGYGNLIFTKRFGIYSVINGLYGWGVYRNGNIIFGELFSPHAGIACVAYDTYITKMFSNGRKQTPAASGSDHTATSTRIGYDGSGTQYHFGYIAEILIYNSALSDANITAINKYLAQKYDIKLNQ